MKLAAYRCYRPFEDKTPRMQEFYSKLGITESFLRDVDFRSPGEIAWIIAARTVIGRSLAEKIVKQVDSSGIETSLEQRSKSLSRIVHKMVARSNRSKGLEPSESLKFAFRMAGYVAPEISLGTIRDWYGIRLITPEGPSSRDRCYDILEKVMEVAGISEASMLLGMVDYLSFHQNRRDEDGRVLGRYESLHASFFYYGIPIEIQVRDSLMHQNALNRVKRSRIDK